MQIKTARYEGGELRLSTTPREAIRFIKRFKEGEYDIVKAEKKRSLDANAYAWVLIAQISNALGIDKYEIYRDAVRHCNQFVPLVVRNDAIADTIRVWQSRGLGWQIEKVDTIGDSHTQLFAHYGSSVYDTKAMSQLIDHLVQDCKSLGIETKPEEEIESLLEAWG